MSSDFNLQHFKLIFLLNLPEIHWEQMILIDFNLLSVDFSLQPSKKSIEKIGFQFQMKAK